MGADCVTQVKACKDCDHAGVLTKRVASFPGPRCATHHRAERARAKARAHETTVARKFGLAPGEYERLYRLQGGVCAWCQLANGTGKRKLAVDHDHRTGRPRGLLCSACNQFLGFQMRDNAEAIKRGVEYLRRPPYDRIHFESID